MCPERVSGLDELLVRTTPEPEAVESYVEAVAFVGTALMWSFERQKTEALVERLTQVGADVMPHSPMARGFASMLETSALYFFEARPWQGFKVAEQGLRDFKAVGSERNANILRILWGMHLAAMGELLGAMWTLREALDISSRTEGHLLLDSVLFYLNLVQAHSPEPGERQEAHAWALEWVGRESAYLFIPGMTHALLARMTAAGGALSEAESLARKACELLVPFPVYLTYARTVLSDILRAQGRSAEAREVAALGVQELEGMSNEGVYAVAMHLALAEACFAQGDASAGEAALRKALRCVRARASDIPEPEARERFLRQVPENARTLELARERWGESSA